MAVLAAAQLLDELMGRHRNVAPNEQFKATDWEEPEYCKFFMVQFCPHDLFVNTRADLGPCMKTHDDEARKLFQEAKKTHYRKVQYQEDFVRFCTSMINEVDRKIIKGRQRLALNAKSVLSATNPAQAEKNQEKINILNERINELEKEAEQAGTDGNVEQAQGLMKLCDQLKEEREALKKSELGHLNITAQLAVEQEKQMEVCEVCGAFLIVGDAQQRIDDHLMGKQHMGYMRLKKAVEEVSAIIKGVKEPKRSRDKDREREKEKERERDKRREREREEKERVEKEKTRDREKSSERERSRSEQRDRDKDKDKERERRKDEERDRKDRDRDRRGHSRDTELVRESKLRERERDRDRDRDRRHRSDRDDHYRHHHRHHHHHSSSHRHRH